MIIFPFSEKTNKKNLLTSYFIFLLSMSWQYTNW